jgi:hypothetical protein
MAVESAHPMLVYRNEARLCDTLQVWAALLDQAASLGASAPHDALVSVLIDLGELEAGVNDCLFPDIDGTDDVSRSLRRASITVARAVLDSWHGVRPARRASIAAVMDALRAVPITRVPPRVALRPSEGYAFYAVHPESYSSAAASFFERARPPAIVAIGIRGIGASLSAMVAARACEDGIPAQSYTVRPRGHPFDRRVAIDAALASRIRSNTAGTHYLIVDEGPGLSGSSFASTARALVDVGIEPAAIVFFPSWDTDGTAFKSEAARKVWQAHRRCPADASVGGARLLAALDSTSDVVHVSAGEWRRHWCGAEATWPAVHPQHERSKAWAPAEGAVVRFAGLGRYGRARLDRAQALADAALGVTPQGLRGGYLRLPYAEGTVCGPVDACNPGLVERAARHIAFLARQFPCEERTPIDHVEEMIRTNVRTILGEPWLVAATSVIGHGRSAIAGAPAVAIDGRMLAHEWIRTRDGFLKVDALDHHADHFFPGVFDPAWDLASASIELRMTEDATRALVETYARMTGDRDVHARLPWHRVAYLAFRTGYVAMAAESLGGSADGTRFARLVPAYSALLRRELAATPSAP